MDVRSGSLATAADRERDEGSRVEAVLATGPRNDTLARSMDELSDAEDVLDQLDYCRLQAS